MDATQPVLPSILPFKFQPIDESNTFDPHSSDDTEAQTLKARTLLQDQGFFFYKFFEPDATISIPPTKLNKQKKERFISAQTYFQTALLNDAHDFNDQFRQRMQHPSGSVLTPFDRRDNLEYFLTRIPSIDKKTAAPEKADPAATVTMARQWGHLFAHSVLHPFWQSHTIPVYDQDEHDGNDTDDMLRRWLDAPQLLKIFYPGIDVQHDSLSITVLRNYHHIPALSKLPKTEAKNICPKQFKLTKDENDDLQNYKFYLAVTPMYFICVPASHTQDKHADMARVWADSVRVESKTIETWFRDTTQTVPMISNAPPGWDPLRIWNTQHVYYIPPGTCMVANDNLWAVPMATINAFFPQHELWASIFQVTRVPGTPPKAAAARGPEKEKPAEQEGEEPAAASDSDKEEAEPQPPSPKSRKNKKRKDNDGGYHGTFEKHVEEKPQSPGEGDEKYKTPKDQDEAADYQKTIEGFERMKEEAKFSHPYLIRELDDEIRGYTEALNKYVDSLKPS